MKTSASSNSPLAFDRYPEYQNSNVEWLGDVPASWEVKKVKRLCLVRRGASPRPIDDLVYFDDEGEYAWVRIADVTASDRYLEHTTQRLSNLGKSKSVPLEPGELFVSIAATVGKPIITKIKCCIHDGFVYFVGLNENREYLYYVFSCGEPYRGLGKLGTQLNLNTATIGDIFLPVPSRQQQDAIVRFLDRETGKIDALVAKKEELIELLQEKRTALITHAVTKGLDPNASTKDSGIEWLGEIPAHWEALRLGFLLREKPRNGISPTIGPGGSVPTFSISAVSRGRVRIRDHLKFADIGEAEAAAFLVARGDVLILRGNGNRSLVRKAGIVVDEPPQGCIYPDILIRLRPSGSMHPEFLVDVLNSKGVRHQIELSAKTAAGIWKLSGSSISSIVLPVPPIREQRHIRERVSEQDSEFERLLSKVTEGINRLQELRTSLISAAVTGKIDVQGEVA